MKLSDAHDYKDEGVCVHPEPSNQYLVAHYKLWDGLNGATTVFDYSLNGLTGTVSGTNCEPAYEGFKFNGTDDFIDVGTGPNPTKTISIWIKQDDVDGNEYPIDLNGTDYISIESGVVTVNGLAGHTLYVNGLAGTSGVTTITALTWNHIVVTDSTANNASDLDIGRVTAAYFAGKISDVRLYSTVLSFPEVKSIYELTKWRYQ